MNIKDKQDPISIEDAKKLFADHDHKSSVDSVRSSVWKSHWANAQEATSSLQLINMLKNHMRIFDGNPSSSGFVFEPDLSEERVRIIKFIENRLKNEFGVNLQQNNQKKISLNNLIQSASTRAVQPQPTYRQMEIEPEL